MLLKIPCVQEILCFIIKEYYYGDNSRCYGNWVCKKGKRA